MYVFKKAKENHVRGTQHSPLSLLPVTWCFSFRKPFGTNNSPFTPVHWTAQSNISPQGYSSPVLFGVGFFFHSGEGKLHG